MASRLQQWQDFCYNRHDVYCNQKYGENDSLPYSFHLSAVGKQALPFLNLIDDDYIMNNNNNQSFPANIKLLVQLALEGHDLEEDARMTYNDVRKEVNNILGNYEAATFVADIIHCVTDEKGKTREFRKSDKYYRELYLNKYAVFVKLCDIAANTLYSKLVRSSMYEKYKKEFPRVRRKLYLPEYEELFNYIESL